MNDSLEKARAFPDKEEIREAIVSVLGANGMGDMLSPQQLDTLASFGNYLSTENGKYNLTAITDPYGMALLHFADSLLFADLLPSGACVADVGCGAGLPSIPLAIARPDLNFTCIDSTAKKIRFIESFVAAQGLKNVITVCGRAEELFSSSAKGSLREQFDAVTARGVAGLGFLSEICCAAVKPGGTFIALKGKNVYDELPPKVSSLRGTGLKIEDVIFRKLISNNDKPSRAAVVMRKISNSFPNYPRQYKDILKKPLFKC